MHTISEKNVGMQQIQEKWMMQNNRKIIQQNFLKYELYMNYVLSSMRATYPGCTMHLPATGLPGYLSDGFPHHPKPSNLKPMQLLHRSNDSFHYMPCIILQQDTFQCIPEPYTKAQASFLNLTNSSSNTKYPFLHSHPRMFVQRIECLGHG